MRTGFNAAKPNTGPAANKHHTIAHPTCVILSAREGYFHQKPSASMHGDKY
ncbi:hypothetical protein JL09_g6405 [Pichia kudriavzevii]|uniref:Uncharacterized protein n=1 Tax=Pichia kudriavzevii TaxID=4909 RepID=A0A099NNV9_PICKU|nr:hypothetical protein JL09_g6405 [Pichia kudriavzevii]